jgi:hypothetical protein
MDPSDKLFTNRFISTNVVTDRTQEEYDKFRRDFSNYWQEKEAVQQLTEIGNGDDLNPDLPPTDLLNTNAIDFEPENGQETFLQQPDEDGEERTFKTRKTLVNVDSRNRNIQLYPDENHYVIDLKRQFTNVKLVQLRSSEFPNSEQLIRTSPPSRANNKIYWLNKDDSTVFVASIAAGNYTPATLQTEIQTKMNAVRKSDGNFHEFTVTVDSVTNLASFSSLSSTQLSDPFNVSAPSQTITVNMTGHGFALNDLITISGASAFSGINVALLNDDHVITSVPNAMHSLTMITLLHLYPMQTLLQLNFQKLLLKVHQMKVQVVQLYVLVVVHYLNSYGPEMVLWLIYLVLIKKILLNMLHLLVIQN